MAQRLALTPNRNATTERVEEELLGKAAGKEASKTDVPRPSFLKDPTIPNRVVRLRPSSGKSKWV